MKRQHTNQILRMTHFSSSSAFCQTEVVSRLSPVYTLLSLSLWPNHPPSPSLVSHYFPLFSPSFVLFSSHPLSQVATWPVSYFPETLFALWLLHAVKHMHMQVQQGRSKVRRGHKFPSDPLFFSNAHTNTLSHTQSCCADTVPFELLNYLYFYKNTFSFSATRKCDYFLHYFCGHQDWAHCSYSHSKCAWDGIGELSPK